MRKVAVIAVPIDLDELGVDGDNEALTQSHENGDWFILLDKESEYDLIYIVDESEKADADSTGETNGPTGLYEVPC